MATTPPLIKLQPKQGDTYDLVEGAGATWIGIGGGRGGAKSGCLQRIMLARRLKYPGTIGVIVMRNSDQVRRYHEDVMLRTWPQLRRNYAKTERKLILPLRGGDASEIHFTYAENLEDVIRRFRSANYFDIFVDQAEQFSESELREIKQAVRWPSVPMGTCKLLLAFNMGGAGIAFLRSKFHLREYNVRERAADYAFVHVGPYDNVEWARPSLESDGLTEEDYYGWPEEARREYCAERTDYGRALCSQDEALVQRDWEGSWESLEGSFFGRTFDRDAIVLPPEVVQLLLKPWWERWLGQDWGRGHYCPTYWAARGQISPAEAKEILGWELRTPLKVALIYREYIAGGEAAQDGGAQREFAEQDIARGIIRRTEPSESMADFFLSPDAFAKRSSHNTIAQEIASVMYESNFPAPRAADNDRIGGWALMSNLMLGTRRKGQMGDDILFISSNCPELINSIPLAMRDPSNLDDILKTDKGTAKIEQDCLDAARYTLKSMLEPGTMRRDDRINTRMEEFRENGLDERSLLIHRIRMEREMPQDFAPATIGRRLRGPITR